MTALTMMLAISLLGVGVLPAAAQSLSSKPCSSFLDVLREAGRENFLTRDEIRPRLTVIYQEAEHAEPDVRRAAAGMLRAATAGGAGASEAIQAMASACEKAHPTSPVWRQLRAGTATGIVTRQQADRHLRDVLEREGETGAKCTQRQFGTGWVAVCDPGSTGS